MFRYNGAGSSVLTNTIFMLRYSRFQSSESRGRSDGSGRVLPLFGYYIILNFLKGPILVQCIQYYYIYKFIDCNFDFVCYFPLPCGSCSRGYPVGNYYVFVLWLNGLGVRRRCHFLKEKKKKKSARLPYALGD